MRQEGISNAYAAHELESRTFSEIVSHHIGRPFAMIVREPLIQGASLWISLVYSIIYFFFEVFPVVFVDQNHIPFQLGGLPFIGITLGMVVCVLTMDASVSISKRVTIPFVDPPVVGTPTTEPEAGLKTVIPAMALMPISMFWFAWTSLGNVHWISPTLAGVPFGYSLLAVWYSFNAYSSQTYQIYASSALAATTLLRAVLASILPVVAHPLLNNLGTAWGVSIFGFLSLGLFPVPLLFVRYGHFLRDKSFYAQEARSIIVAMRQTDVN
ncbi:hypothetical protein SCHPADRAFT_402325 [Schizopora paradoxa]|uniref:MFS general substrate transporter n=1 Tax=Schizopora paradoxa TaxID=27342 RepID=A0A0H2RL58_9AGAM|nr:hypothetical protein SCHPADRAFT_402325 [Schizopora paradoxa]